MGWSDGHPPALSHWRYERHNVIRFELALKEVEVNIGDYSAITSRIMSAKLGMELMGWENFIE